MPNITAELMFFISQIVNLRCEFTATSSFADSTKLLRFYQIYGFLTNQTITSK